MAVSLWLLQSYSVPASVVLCDTNDKSGVHYLRGHRADVTSAIESATVSDKALLLAFLALEIGAEGEISHIAP